MFVFRIQPMNTLIQQVKRIKNISEFAKKSGVPRRTLVRIKAYKKAEEYPLRPTTRLALEGAIKKYKPEMIEEATTGSTKEPK